MLGYNKAFKQTITDEELDFMFKKIDTNKSGTIDYSGKIENSLIIFPEFVAASLDRRKMLKKERLKKVFNMFDKVHSFDFLDNFRMDQVKQMQMR